MGGSVAAAARRSGTGLAVAHDVLPPDLLSANVDALVRAQGFAPHVANVRDDMRVSMHGDELRAELCIGDNEWRPVDFPAAGSPDGARWLRAACGTGSTQVIVTGIGLGHALDEASAFGSLKVLAIEPDPGLAALFLARRDWRDWVSSGRLRLLTGPDYRGATDVARFLDGLSEIPIVAHPLRLQVEPRAVAVATVVAGRVAKSARSNGEARRRFAGPYLLQTLANLPAIGREAGVDGLDQACRGIPAIIVGAGPSLDANVADLRRLGERGLIIAADTAVRPLLAAGAPPHIAVAADSSDLNARHLTTAAGVDDVMLVAEGSVHPSALEHFSGRTFTFRVSEHEPWPWLETAGIRRAELRTWGSVLTSAFDLARRMGCNPIVFAGADMAFTGMRPYCRGTIYDAMWQEWIDKGCSWDLLMADYFSRQPEVWTDDITGARVRTAPHLVSFRNWLAEQMAGDSERTFINATGGGILQGTAIRQATLDEALGAFAAVPDVRARLRDRHAAGRLHSGDAARMEDLLARTRRSPDAVPFERWRAFAAGTVSDDQIRTALGVDRG